ncbi:MAG: pyridoxine 5'-phosphate synthase, partial [Planctomycetes bacterium]|nr:pyridoxine 5'-phosphate synthase [Planctomycetota bacterium]
MKLGINIDHVATLREARATSYPDPVKAAKLAELAGCDLITCHLREDRRHIQDKDLFKLRKSVTTELNLEMSINPEIVKIALKVRPDKITLVPEKRSELTTEGGLDVIKYRKAIEKINMKMKNNKIRTSLFIEPNHLQIDVAVELGADEVELHTGRYANADKLKRSMFLEEIRKCSKYASEKGLVVAAGHGLNYENVKQIAKISYIEELNIG